MREAGMRAGRRSRRGHLIRPQPPPSSGPQRDPAPTGDSTRLTAREIRITVVVDRAAVQVDDRIHFTVTVRVGCDQIDPAVAVGVLDLGFESRRRYRAPTGSHKPGITAVHRPGRRVRVTAFTLAGAFVVSCCAGGTIQRRGGNPASGSDGSVRPTLLPSRTDGSSLFARATSSFNSARERSAATR